MEVAIPFHLTLASQIFPLFAITLVRQYRDKQSGKKQDTDDYHERVHVPLIVP